MANCQDAVVPKMSVNWTISALVRVKSPSEPRLAENSGVVSFNTPFSPSCGMRVKIRTSTVPQIGNRAFTSPFISGLSTTPSTGTRPMFLWARNAETTRPIMPPRSDGNS